MNTTVNFHSKRFLISLVASFVLHIILGGILIFNFKPTSKIVDTPKNKSSDTIETEKSIQGQPVTSPPPDLPKNKSRSAQFIIHTVKPGDSFWKIAKKYDLTIESILELNNLESDHILKVDEKLKIPSEE